MISKKVMARRLNNYCKGDHSDRMEASFFSYFHFPISEKQRKAISLAAQDIRMIETLKNSIDYANRMQK